MSTVIQSPLPAADATAAIDVVEKITAEDFLHGYIKQNRPLVMTRMMDMWPAKDKWTFEFFSQLSLEGEVHLEDGNIMQEDTRYHKASFREFLARLLDAPDTDAGTRQPYLSVFKIFSAFPQLEGDVDFSILNRYKMKHTVSGWIGPAGTVTGYHIDWGDNILAQLSGRKRLLLVAPSQTRYMYKSRKFDQGTTLSQVDADRPDLDRFPLYAKATPIEVILHPGQMLFIPRGWWHQVRSLDKSISVSNIAYDLRGILVDAGPFRVKQILHNAGLFHRGECTCHMHRDGRRVPR